jgi:hypothetical protein
MTRDFDAAVAEAVAFTNDLRADPGYLPEFPDTTTPTGAPTMTDPNTAAARDLVAQANAIADTDPEQATRLMARSQELADTETPKAWAGRTGGHVRPMVSELTVKITLYHDRNLHVIDTQTLAAAAADRVAEVAMGPFPADAPRGTWGRRSWIGPENGNHVEAFLVGAAMVRVEQPID